VLETKIKGPNILLRDDNQTIFLNEQVDENYCHVKKVNLENIGLGFFKWWIGFLINKKLPWLLFQIIMAYFCGKPNSCNNIMNHVASLNGRKDYRVFYLC
jgi:hypothetical protein